MGISMSNASIDSSKRDSMLNSKYDYNTLGEGTSFNQKEVVDSEGYLFGLIGRKTHNEDTGVDVAGITGGFVESFKKTIDDYSANVEEALKKLDKVTDVNMDSALKGAGIKDAVVEFVQAVRTTATNYLKALHDAENQIVESVQAAYEQQDKDLSANLKSDASDILNAGPKA